MDNGSYTQLKNEMDNNLKEFDDGFKKEVSKKIYATEKMDSSVGLISRKTAGNGKQIILQHTERCGGNLSVEVLRLAFP